MYSLPAIYPAILDLVLLIQSSFLLWRGFRNDSQKSVIWVELVVVLLGKSNLYGDQLDNQTIHVHLLKLLVNQLATPQALFFSAHVAGCTYIATHFITQQALDSTV